MVDYFFSGNRYIRVTRGDTGPGGIDAGYPAPISNWNWGTFGANGIDAAVYSGSKCYFFSGNQYIRVTRGVTGPGAVDPGYPAPIANWNWGAFGANGIDAALNSGPKCYFFSGNQYIRVSRGETGPGSVDPGYPAPISNWNWGAFGANGIDAALYSGSKCYFFSSNQYIRVSRGDIGPGLLDAGYPAPISNWGWGAFGSSGITGALYSGGPFATPPTQLGSNSNYFLSNCSALTGLTATINVDVDMKSDDGFGFQLNAYSTRPDNADAAQQYLVYYDNTNLVAMVDNWTSSNTEVVNHQVTLTGLPNQTLPAGYALQISLQTDGSNRVTGANYLVLDHSGRSIGSTSMVLTSLTKDNGQPVSTADLAPIVAFQLDLVGKYNGEQAKLTSGAGTMTFMASDLMTIGNTEPSCVDWDYSTVETANCVYGLLPAAANTSFTQYFDATPAAAINRIARVRHITRPRP